MQDTVTFICLKLRNNTHYTAINCVLKVVSNTISGAQHTVYCPYFYSCSKYPTISKTECIKNLTGYIEEHHLETEVFDNLL